MEVCCCDERGLARFDVLRQRRNEVDAFLSWGTDLRREPIEVRKASLASILRQSRHGVRSNEHLEHDCGLTVFQHACKIGLEGIVSKRLSKLATSFERACNTILLFCNDLLALALQCRSPGTQMAEHRSAERSCVANHTDAQLRFVRGR
jgi:hypothetical protein